MKCPDCSKSMQWNQKLNGFVCPQGCFAAYEMARKRTSYSQADAVADYLETVNSAAKESSYGYQH